MEEPVTRRSVLGAAGAVAAGTLAAGAFLRAHAAGKESPTQTFEVDSAGFGSSHRRMHGGKGELGVKFFFEPERPSRPALFLQYDIPPGASEGEHIHAHGHPEGPWDEYYYVVAGSGTMRIDGRAVPVKRGDHVHAPLGVAHGIENTGHEPLRVLLTAIHRG